MINWENYRLNDYEIGYLLHPQFWELSDSMIWSFGAKDKGSAAFVELMLKISTVALLSHCMYHDITWPYHTTCFCSCEHICRWYLHYAKNIWRHSSRWRVPGWSEEDMSFSWPAGTCTQLSLALFELLTNLFLNWNQSFVRCGAVWFFYLNSDFGGSGALKCVTCCPKEPTMFKQAQDICAACFRPDGVFKRRHTPSVSATRPSRN